MSFSGRTRREFLGDALRLGAGVAVAAFSPRFAMPVLAQGARVERVQVLVDDQADQSAADFSAGQARGAVIGGGAGQSSLRGSRGAQFTSRILPLPFASTHLGVHWVISEGSPEGLLLETRSSADGKSWADWQPLAVEAVAEVPGGREYFASLVSGGSGRFAQYRVSFQSDQAIDVRKVTVTSINSVDGPREAVAAAISAVTLSAPVGSINVITREGWGCDESLRFRRSKELWPEMYVPAKKVVLHHTATSNSYTNAAAEIRAIYTYHARTQGWGDIGYNSLVDRDGNIYEGRHGRGEGSGREILSSAVVAGHVLSHNYGSTGIAALGNFDTAVPTSAMLSAIVELATFECGRSFIDPSSSSDFLRSDDSWHSNLANISGHYESYATECPGAALKDYLRTLRAEVASRIAGSAAPVLSSGSARELTAPASLDLQWPAFGELFEYCLEGWYKPSSSDDINYLQGYGDGGYNDTLAKVQVWSGPTNATSTSFQDLAAGHYTMHLRSESGKYESNLTFLVKGGTTTRKPPRK